MSTAAVIVFVIVILSWFAFAALFLTRKKPPQIVAKRRDPRSIAGIVLQGFSFAIVWGLHRPYFSALGASQALGIFLSVVSSMVAIGSVLFTMQAVKTLGKEWSLTAQVIEGHKLATHGPYAYVRHPIYTGMLGMLVATGLATSYWQALVVAITVFMVGTFIRIRSEEMLLRETFGSAFEDYSRRVAAVLPKIL